MVSNIFYHFLFAVSLGNKASKMSENFRQYRKIGFRNTFYTKCINVIIDSIGPSIILRSKLSGKGPFEEFVWKLCIPVNRVSVMLGRLPVFLS